MNEHERRCQQVAKRAEELGLTPEELVAQIEQSILEFRVAGIYDCDWWMMMRALDIEAPL